VAKLNPQSEVLQLSFLEESPVPTLQIKMKKEGLQECSAYLNATERTGHMPVYHAFSAEQLHAVALTAAVLGRLAAGADGVLAH
jgi:hypothetical protein